MVMCCDGCIKVDMSFVLTFCAGVSAAMNELRPCAPLSLKNVLAEEVVKGLQAVSDSLVRYNAMRMLRGNESSLFLSLCQAFIEVRGLWKKEYFCPIPQTNNIPNYDQVVFLYT